jgi:hypothetical protein
LNAIAGALLLSGFSLISSTTSAMEVVGNRTLFISSAVENPADDTVKLPLYRGVSQGQTVWYIITDASTGDAANKYRVNRADKLNNAKNTTAVQKVRLVNGVVEFPATVNFNADNLENSVVA